MWLWLNFSRFSSYSGKYMVNFFFCTLGYIFFPGMNELNHFAFAKLLTTKFQKFLTKREKCPSWRFFWVAFSHSQLNTEIFFLNLRIQSECREIQTRTKIWIWTSFMQCLTTYFNMPIFEKRITCILQKLEDWFEEILVC